MVYSSDDREICAKYVRGKRFIQRLNRGVLMKKVYCLIRRKLQCGFLRIKTLWAADDRLFCLDKYSMTHFSVLINIEYAHFSKKIHIKKHIFLTNLKGEKHIFPEK